MENTNTFAVRLKQIRDEKKMTQKTFSEYLEIKQQTLSGYEIGKISPSLEVAFSIAQKLNVSLDWLCGLSNERNNSAEQFGTYGEIFQQLVKIDKSNHICIKSVKLGGDDKQVILMNDSIVQIFLEEWGKILTLFHDGIINKSLYDLWVNEKIQYYKVRLNDFDEYMEFMQILEMEKRMDG